MCCVECGLPQILRLTSTTPIWFLGLFKGSPAYSMTGAAGSDLMTDLWSFIQLQLNHFCQFVYMCHGQTILFDGQLEPTECIILVASTEKGDWLRSLYVLCKWAGSAVQWSAGERTELSLVSGLMIAIWSLMPLSSSAEWSPLRPIGMP